MMINQAILETDFLDIDSITDTNMRWLELKTKISKIIDEIAPLREIKLQAREQCPWFDDELFESKYQRDTAYKNFCSDRSTGTHKIYVNLRRSHQNLLNNKMINYFNYCVFF